MTIKTGVTVSTEPVGNLISGIWNILTNRNVHKVTSLALAVYAFIAKDFGYLVVGASSTVGLHIAGAIKQLPDSGEVATVIKSVATDL